MKRLAGTPQYIMNHIDLRRTFASGSGLKRTRTQPANGFELGFQRDLDSMQHSSLDFIFFHRRYPPVDSPSGLKSQSRGYHNTSTSVNKITPLHTLNVQTPDTHLKVGVNERIISGEGLLTRHAYRYHQHT